MAEWVVVAVWLACVLVALAVELAGQERRRVGAWWDESWGRCYSAHGDWTDDGKPRNDIARAIERTHRELQALIDAAADGRL